MDFKSINDYEILYLIKEGNEVALTLLFDKYESYIWKTAKSYYAYNEKLEDLVQEGRMMLLRCIRLYNEDLGISFFSFFTLCMKRDFVHKLGGDYYQNHVSFNEGSLGTMDYSKSIIYTSESFVEALEEKELYQFVVLDGLSIRLYAEKKHLSYWQVYYKYAQLIEILKKLV